jgi:hypothetical protein
VIRAATFLLGVSVTACFASAFVSLALLRLAAEMASPCRCGEAHDPMDECPGGPVSLRPHEIQERT